MPDQSFLDNRYFVDESVYNCPFCNRRHVSYSIYRISVFDWTENKECFVYFICCHSCKKRSMHLSYTEIPVNYPSRRASSGVFNLYGIEGNLDDLFFYSVPTSLFVLDSRVPLILRELLTEAEGSLKSNFLTGASACARKIVYELAVEKGADSGTYEEQIKSLKKKHPDVDEGYFDTLLTIQQATSSKVHENAYDGWEASHLRLILASLREVLHELYVEPELRKDRRKANSRPQE